MSFFESLRKQLGVRSRQLNRPANALVCCLLVGAFGCGIKPAGVIRSNSTDLPDNSSGDAKSPDLEPAPEIPKDICETRKSKDPSWETHVKPLLDQYCVSCHNSSTMNGGLNYDLEAAKGDSWNAVQKAYLAIDGGTMPPPPAHPTSCELGLMGDWLSKTKDANSEKSDCTGRADSFEAAVLPTAKEFCAGCHGEGSKLSRFDIVDDPNDSRSRTERWTVALNMIKAKAMPPHGPYPDDCVVSRIDTWLKSQQPLPNSGACSDDLAPRRVMTPLSKFELRNAITDLFGDEVAISVDPILLMYPKDVRYSDATINDSIAIVTKVIGEQIGRYLESNDEVLTAITKCTVNLSSAALSECFDRFVLSFGQRTQRVPIPRAELEEYHKAIFDGTMQSFVNLIQIFLQTPRFLYKIEEHPNSVDPTSWELASRLSFAIWKSIPSQELLEKAALGNLNDGRFFNLEAQKMYRDGRGNRALKNFITSTYELDPVEVPSQPDFFLGELDRNSFAPDVESEFQSFLDYIFDSRGTVTNLLSSRVVMVNSDTISRLYGLPISPFYQAFPQDYASGLLGRAAILFQNRLTTLPPKRGHFIRSVLLCQSVSSETAFHGSFGEHKADFALMGNRQEWEEKTSDAACSSCHRRLNHLGFAFEGFDTLGRHRDTEIQYAEDGSVLAEFPLDLTVTPYVTPDDDKTFNGSRELALYLAKHPAVHDCFSKHAYRYIFEFAATARENCMITRDRLGKSKMDTPIVEVMKDFILRTGFRKKAN